MANTPAPSSETTATNIDLSWQNVLETLTTFFGGLPGTFMELSALMQYSIGALTLSILISWIATRYNANLIGNISFLGIPLSITAICAGLAGYNVEDFINIF
ncbi:MAG: hypothetical protein VX730_07720 [Pseudomonadota bacterium]|nr:hypothetical protein [Pseudomonadota bacterium]